MFCMGFVADYGYEEGIADDIDGSGLEMPALETQSAVSAKKGVEPARIWSSFPETWLWDIVSTGWVG